MLQNIHEHIKGWVAGIIIFLVSLSFIVWGIQYYLEGGNAQTTPVAKVNGTSITQQDLNQAYQNLSRQTGQAGLSVDEQAQLKKLALTQLIHEQALIQSANKLGFYVDQGQVNALITQLPEFQENGQFSSQKLQQYIYNTSSTPQAFMTNLRNTILINQMHLGLTLSSFALPKEINAAYSLAKQTRDIGYVVINPEHLPKISQPTAAQLAQFYQKNQALFRLPERVKLNYILLSPQSLAKHVKVSDAAVKQYYQDNQQSYVRPQQWQLAEIIVPVAQGSTQLEQQQAQLKIKNIIKQLQSNIPFAKVYAENKGKTYWLSLGQMPDELAAVVNKMQVGQLTKPIQTRQGYVIAKLVATRAQQQKSFKEVESQIKQTLVQQQVAEQFANISDQLSNLSYTNPDSLEPAAKATGLSIQQTDWLTRNVNKGLFADPKLLSAAFNKDVLQGDNSNPISLQNGDLVVLRIAQHQPARVPPLQQIHSQVEQTYLQQTQLDKAKQLAKVIAADLTHANNAAEVAKKYHLSWQIQSNLVAPTSKSSQPTLAETAFELARSAPQNVTTVQMPDHKIVVMKLLAVHQPNLKQAQVSELQQINQQLAYAMGQVDYSLYALDAVKNAKIKIIAPALK